MTAAPPEPAADYLELAEMAGGFIHELKNRVNALSLNLQLLAEDFDPPASPRERRALDRVGLLGGECRRIAALSHDFLRYARPDAARLAPADLAAAVGRLVDFVTPTARARNVDVVWHPAPDLPPVLLDADLFETALLNVVLNAEEAMPAGGTLTLQARGEGGRVLLDVIDTGRGMPPGVAAEAFRPFLTTKRNGSGLGLATARKIVLAHGGDISVRSQEDCGTLFRIDLPAAGAEIDPDAAP